MCGIYTEALWKNQVKRKVGYPAALAAIELIQVSEQN